MYHLTLTWIAAQKFIRSKQVYIVREIDQDSIAKDEDEIKDSINADDIIGDKNPENKKIYEIICRDANYKLREDDMLCLPKALVKDQQLLLQPEVKDKKQEQIAINKLKQMIIFENEHIIVINKDHGVPSQMGSGLESDKNSDISVDTMLSYYCPSNEDGSIGGRLVHRLDQKTGGLMVLAKTKLMARYLGECFRNRDLYKAYYGLVCGVPKYQSGLVYQSYDQNEHGWQIDLQSSQNSQVIKHPIFDTLGLTQDQLDMKTKFEVLTVVQQQTQSQISKEQFDNSLQEKVSQIRQKENLKESGAPKLGNWYPYSSEQVYDLETLQFKSRDQRVIDSRNESYSYVKFQIYSGKKHQIRLLCDNVLNSPLLFDTKYGYDPNVYSKNLFSNNTKSGSNQGVLGLSNNQINDSKMIMLHAGELKIPIEPPKNYSSNVPASELEVAKEQLFIGKMKPQMEKICDFLHINKLYY
eukprot:403369726